VPENDEATPEPKRPPVFYGGGSAISNDWIGSYMVYPSLSPTFQAATLATPKEPRQIFVAYPYKLYPKTDYRKVFKSLAVAFDVKFVFADEKITTLHILEKIEGYIKASQFGIYDISGWNPNVTLELGLAFGLGEKAYIAMDPSKTNVSEVPADLRGLDRIQYDSYTQFEEKLGELIGQELPLLKTHEAQNQLEQLRRQILALLADAESGLKIGDIAKAFGVTTALAQVVVRQLVGKGLRTEGAKKGTRYILDPATLPNSDA